MAVLKTQQVECEMDHGEFWFAHLSTVNCSLSAELDEVLYSSEILSGYSSLRHYETIFVDLGKKSVGCDLPSLCFIVCLICCLISSCQGFYNLLDSLQYEFDFNLHQPFRTLCIWNALFLGSYFGHLSLSGSIILLCQENLLRLFLFFLAFFWCGPWRTCQGWLCPQVHILKWRLGVSKSDLEVSIAFTNFSSEKTWWVMAFLSLWTFPETIIDWS